MGHSQDGSCGQVSLEPNNKAFQGSLLPTCLAIEWEAESPNPQDGP